jgi:hypothetical protein
MYSHETAVKKGSEPGVESSKAESADSIRSKSVSVARRTEALPVRVQAETMGFRKRWPEHEVCKHTPVDAVEWYSDIRPGIMTYGLLVRVWPADGPEPAHLRSPVDPESGPLWRGPAA